MDIKNPKSTCSLTHSLTRSLILFRHGKSSWDEPACVDHDRPLKKKGERKTRLAAERLLERIDAGAFDRPDRIVSSTAVRAVQTAEIVLDVLGLAPSRMVLENRLYDTSADEYRDVVQEADEHIRTLMLIGHNPSISHLAYSFLREQAGELHTSGCVVIGFEADTWKKIAHALPRPLHLAYSVSCD